MSSSKLVAITCITAAIVACSAADSPEAHVRKAIEAMEKSAEERDVGGVTENLSEQFRDAYGRDRKELTQYIRGYILANQSIHLLTRINSIEFPTPEEARVQITVGMAGRDADESNAWNLAAEIHDFDVTFMREEDDWKVTWFNLRS